LKDGICFLTPCIFIPLPDSTCTSRHEEAQAAGLGATEDEYCTPDNSSKKELEEFQEYVKLDDIRPVERFGLMWRRRAPPEHQLTRIRTGLRYSHTAFP